MPNEEMKAKVLAASKDLSEVLNRHGIDNEIGIPDHILADYLMAHIGTLRLMDLKIRDWYGA